MRLYLIAAASLPMLLLAGCGGGAPAPASSSIAAAPPQTTEAAAAPAPVLAAASGPRAADDKLQPLYGTWGLDPANCGGQVLKISKTRFEGPGSGCDITGFSDNGNGSYTATMSCSAGGQTASEQVQMRPIFAPTGEGVDLVYLNRQNLASEVLRCDVPAN